MKDHALTRARALVVSLVFVIIGLVLVLGVAPEVRTSDRPAVFEVGAVILTIGLVSFGYEFYLRRAFTHELLDMVGLAHDLRRVGIKQICPEPELDWTNLLENATEYKLLFLDPTAWVAQEWPRVLAAARRRQAHINVYLPDPGGPQLGAIAERLGVTAAALQQRLGDAEQEIENAWKNARNSSRAPVRGSSLAVRYFTAVPGYGLCVIDDAVVFLLAPSIIRKPADTSLVVRFERSEQALVVGWALTQLARLDAIPPVYAG